MIFASTRLITADVARLVAFYEAVTSLTATWATSDFAEISSPGATLAIGSMRTMVLFGGDAAIAPAGASGRAIFEFRTVDVDGRFLALSDRLADVVQPPTTQPWGNRSALFRDPDGNLVNLFEPVTADARAKHGL